LKIGVAMENLKAVVGLRVKLDKGKEYACM
jgi:hypothetical protein